MNDIILKVLLLSLVAAYSLDSYANKMTESLEQNCTSLDMLNAPIGSKCSSKEIIFTRVERPGFPIAWKANNGLIWGFFPDQMNHEKSLYRAQKFCNSLNARLPTKQELFGDSCTNSSSNFPCGALSEEATDHWSNCYWTGSEEITLGVTAQEYIVPQSKHVSFCCYGGENKYTGTRNYGLSKEYFPPSAKAKAICVSHNPT